MYDNLTDDITRKRRRSQEIIPGRFYYVDMTLYLSPSEPVEEMLTVTGYIHHDEGTTVVYRDSAGNTGEGYVPPF